MQVVNTKAQIDEIIQVFPDDFCEVDEGFMEKFRTQIESLKELTEPTGGIFIAEFDDKQIIFRLPHQTWYLHHQKRAEKLEGIDSNFALIGECMLFPKLEVFKVYVNKGKFGLIGNVALAIIRELRFTTEVKTKKL